MQRTIFSLTFGAALALGVYACGGGNSAYNFDAGSDGGAGEAGSAGAGGGGGTCINSLDCRGEPEARTICDKASGRCVQCVTAQDCEPNHDCTKSACVRYTPCTSSLQCSSPEVCDGVRGRCVRCVTSPDCEQGETCSANRCRPQCQSDNHCTPLGLLCDKAQGFCVDCVREQDCDPGKRCVAGSCE